MVKFSFIIPVYNVKPYLKECLDSVFNQNFSDFEICLVDDGSTDGSGTICDEYSNRDNRIKVYHQTNGGVSVARNKALEMAVGEFIWFVDADDYILPGALEYLNKVTCESKCDTIFFGSQLPDLLGKPFYESDDKDTFLASHISYFNLLMIFKRQIR